MIWIPSVILEAGLLGYEIDHHASTGMLAFIGAMLVLCLVMAVTEIRR